MRFTEVSISEFWPSAVLDTASAAIAPSRKTNLMLFCLDWLQYCAVGTGLSFIHLDVGKTNVTNIIWLIYYTCTLHLEKMKKCFGILVCYYMNLIMTLNSLNFMLFIQEADISLQINVTIDATCSNSPERLLEINVTIDTRCFYNLNFIIIND